ncbi:MAG TPA: hypothetical protein ENO23_10225, partial [Alphaproteobacteria bacterium]|nr:hypothetical protein [Alphaproteobacteria bacterium]
RRGIEAEALWPNVMDYRRRVPDLPRRDLDDIARRLGLAEGDIPIVQPTRIVERKSIEIALHFLAALGDPKYKLIITGYEPDTDRAYLDRLKQTIAELGLEGRVIFMDEQETVGLDVEPGLRDGRRLLDLDELYAFVRARHGFATYPSTYEGFGNALLEVVTANLPLVVQPYTVYKRDIRDRGFDFLEFPDISGPAAELGIADPNQIGAADLRRILARPEYQEVLRRTVAEVKARLMEIGDARRMTRRNHRVASRTFSYEAMERILAGTLWTSDEQAVFAGLAEARPGARVRALRTLVARAAGSSQQTRRKLVRRALELLDDPDHLVGVQAWVTLFRLQEQSPADQRGRIEEALSRYQHRAPISLVERDQEWQHDLREFTNAATLNLAALETRLAVLPGGLRARADRLLDLNRRWNRADAAVRRAAADFAARRAQPERLVDAFLALQETFAALADEAAAFSRELAATADGGDDEAWSQFRRVWLVNDLFLQLTRHVLGFRTAGGRADLRVLRDLLAALPEDFRRHVRISAPPDFDARPRRVRADYSAFILVLMNLIQNAQDAVAERAKTAGPDYVPRIEVVFRDREILVTDNGPGVPGDLREKAFERGFTTKGKDGTGLGLFIARRTLRESGGDLELADRAEGAAFVCRFAPGEEALPAAADLEGRLNEDLFTLAMGSAAGPAALAPPAAAPGVAARGERPTVFA